MSNTLSDEENTNKVAEKLLKYALELQKCLPLERKGRLSSQDQELLQKTMQNEHNLKQENLKLRRELDTLKNNIGILQTKYQEILNEQNTRTDNTQKRINTKSTKHRKNR